MSARVCARHRSGLARAGYVVLAAVLLLVAGCVEGTDPGDPPVALIGPWVYEGEQLSPSPATIEGTLEVDRQIGRRFEGSLDVIETTAGEARRVTGLVSGLALDAVTLDFDVLIGGVARRHVAEVRGDSLVGVWVEVLSSGGSGTFHATRAAMP